MKRVMSLLMVAILVLGLAACGEKRVEQTDKTIDNATDSTSNENTNNETNSTEEVQNDLSGKTITVGRWGGNEAETAAFAEMLKGFTASTGILVEERVYSDYNQELQAELIGGTAPDVFYVDAYMAPFLISQGVLQELDPDEMELDVFYQPLKDAFLQDGKYYAVSKDYSTLALYYNKKYVNEDEIPETLEELLESNFLTNLQSTLPDGMVPMTYNQDLARNMYIAEAGRLSVTKDDIYSNIADPEIVENLSIIYDAAVAGKIKTPQDIGSGWNGDAFGNEMTAIMIEGNWTLGHLQSNFPDVEFGVIEIPTFKGNKGSMVFTVGYGINVTSKEAEAAKVFIKYATGTEGMATWTTGAGVLPSRRDVTEATNVAADPLKVPHIAAAEYATPWQKGTTMDTINTEYRNYAPSIVTGEKTLEEALKIAEDEANSTIEANQ